MQDASCIVTLLKFSSPVHLIEPFAPDEESPAPAASIALCLFSQDNVGSIQNCIGSFISVLGCSS
jgi:hypothetical protein